MAWRQCLTSGSAGPYVYRYTDLRLTHLLFVVTSEHTSSPHTARIARPECAPGSQKGGRPRASRSGLAGRPPSWQTNLERPVSKVARSTPPARLAKPLGGLLDPRKPAPALPKSGGTRVPCKSRLRATYSGRICIMHGTYCIQYMAAAVSSNEPYTSLRACRDTSTLSNYPSLVLPAECVVQRHQECRE